MSENVPLSYVFGDQAHLWIQIKDQDGELTTPSAITINIFDSADAQLVTDGISTESSTGVYYYTYGIPAAGPEGVWTVEWSYTISSVDYVHKDYMDVFDIVPYTYTTPHPDVVRKYLNNLSEEQLNDATIRICIAVATKAVTPEVGDCVETEDLNLGILVYAAYLSYDKYLIALERAEGRQLPAFIYLHSAQLKEQAENLVKSLGSCEEDGDYDGTLIRAAASFRSYPNRQQPRY